MSTSYIKGVSSFHRRTSSSLPLLVTLPARESDRRTSKVWGCAALQRQPACAVRTGPGTGRERADPIEDAHRCIRMAEGSYVVGDRVWVTDKQNNHHTATVQFVGTVPPTDGITTTATATATATVESCLHDHITLLPHLPHAVISPIPPSTVRRTACFRSRSAHVHTHTCIVVVTC